MERSIENIWKEGFLKEDALVVPKLNDLYNQKSKHIVDKFKRMFKFNLRAIVVGSVVFLGISFLGGIQYMGIILFVMLNILVLINQRILKSLESIKNNDTSYEYLKSFDNWMKEKMVINTKFYRVFYPVFFLAVVIGFWFKEINGENILGQVLMEKLLKRFPDTLLIFELPLWGVVATVIILGLLAYFGERLYKFDLKLGYGRIMNKLEDLLADMEELRS